MNARVVLQTATGGRPYAVARQLKPETSVGVAL